MGRLNGTELLEEAKPAGFLLPWCTALMPDGCR
jgi:hypothetical protein